MNTHTTPAQDSLVDESPQTSNVQSKAVAWLGVTGSTLLMVSATIFVWSGWNEFPNAVKFGILALITAMCFGTGKFLSRSLPVMGSIFTHLAIFLTPVVLLSANMEGTLPWRTFLVIEGFFCVGWFAGIAQVYKSRVLIPAALLSTTLIALGLASLEDTIFGNVPAALYMVPLVIGLALSNKFSRSSLYVLVVVGFSPILTLIQPHMRLGREVFAGFGFVDNVHWGYLIGVAAGLLVATIIASRIQKSIVVLTLIPITVIPYVLMSLSNAHVTQRDLLVIVPLFILMLQALVFLGKTDQFFSGYVSRVTKGLNLFVMIVEGYTAASLIILYTLFIGSNYNNNDAFLVGKPATGLLLLVCAGVVSYISQRDVVQEVLLSFLGFFTVGILAELTGVLSHSHRETRMLVAAIVVGLGAMAFRKNLLACIIFPMTLVAVYVSVSNYSLNSERVVMLVTYIALVLYGIYLLKPSYEPLLWLATSCLAIVLVSFGVLAVPYFLSDTIAYQGLYEIGFIFLVGLAITEVCELLTVGKSYMFTSDTEVSYIRPARVVMATAYISTWFLGQQNGELAPWIMASVVVLFGIIGAWRRRESLTMILTAPTFLVGVAAMVGVFNLDTKMLPLILVGSSGLWLFLSTYMKYATLGCYVQGGLAAFVGVTTSLDNGDSAGQALFLLGLIIIAIGVIRSVPALIPVGAMTSTFGLWFTLAAQEVNVLSLYVAPICVGLIALGMYNRNVFSSFQNDKKSVAEQSVRTSSWEAYAIPIVLFLGTSFTDSLYTGLHVYSLIGGSVALLAIAVGAWRKLIAPLVLGTLFLVVFIIREMFDVANVVPIWAWIGFGAFLLIGVAVLLEKSQMSPSQAKKRLSAVVADHFE